MTRKETIEKIKKMTYKDDFMVFVKSLNLSRDDYRAMMEYIDEILAVQPDHVADISKKVSISCGCENDLISRKMVIDALKETLNPNITKFVQAKLAIENLPSVQPERKKGNWVTVDRRYVKCSECGLKTTKNELRGIALFGENEPNFCPNCGADMRGEP